jgi:adenosylmethionine-8-amino-7-oxononanoate aminotransferase
MITFAKGVSSGYVPLGGVLVGERVRAPFWDDDVPGAVFRHGYTYSGHAGAAAAGMANLDIIEREGLVARVASLEPVLDRAVRRLASAPGVGEIRTVGLTAAIAFRDDLLAADPGLPERAVSAALRHGVATRVLRGHALQISPPFIITEAEIDTMVDGLEAALDDVA